MILVQLVFIILLVAGFGAGSTLSQPIPSQLPAPPGVYGAKNRTPVIGNTYPWCTIGKVEGRDGGHCTGVLIGDRKVLTAGHCLADRARGSAILRPSDFTFSARACGARATSHIRVVTIVRDRERSGLAQTADDWAVLTLAEPAGARRGFLRIEAFSERQWRADRRHGHAYAIAGFSYHRPYDLTRHIGCKLSRFGHSGAVFTHHCDATFGDSGAPVLAKRGSIYKVIGLNVAVARYEGYGIAITGAHLKARIEANAKPPRLQPRPLP